MKATYEAVAQAFKDEPNVSPSPHPFTPNTLSCLTLKLSIIQCIVALVDTNDVQNKHINRKYELVTFPNVKFFPAGSANKATKFVDYEGPRTEAALVDYLNELCGTNVVVSGSGGRAHDGAEL